MGEGGLVDDDPLTSSSTVTLSTFLWGKLGLANPCISLLGTFGCNHPLSKSFVHNVVLNLSLTNFIISIYLQPKLQDLSSKNSTERE